MKLCRVGAPGAEIPAAIDAQGTIRSLASLVPDLTPEWLAPERLAALAAVDLTRLPAIDPATRIGVPVAGIRQFIGIALNYRKHAEESGQAIPAEPIVFTKAITSLSGANDDIVMPPGSEHTDWEIEMGIVIGTTTRSVPVAAALDHVAGYCLANDVSERHWQNFRMGQWNKGKSFDSFGPIGPWLVTADEIPDPHALSMELSVNGEVMQASSTSDMIFSVAELVSYVSQFMTLLPGDVIVSGTPGGVGMGLKPPRYLKQGDVLRLAMDGLGTQTQHVAMEGR
ncbi:fumarylacetoacetate hydrolase family protein [Massilia sp. IC2-477]|uniref:fumarylacetoacetate hydrolase family protein n=1 Tax=unclassified Massilia TaxID=2609279 RepID=UPI001D117D81|nr:MULTISPECIES: fumarylacetoacetate hydrolase family protein [unclassified Massilia]MCC2956756.1 fumarylacetoacetate hydrolase family protein [Massilia sp. IC2-477]MCC2973172.1 fumarylacetoacetate hydrolase family protein [Massilia sp. IC2-476]